MGRSLGTGVGELPAEARAVLVLLTDQPKVGPAVLGKLVHAWRRRPTRVMAAAYGGQLGVPAIFPRAAFRGFRQIEGDTGARRMLRKGGNVDSIDVPEAAFDGDTPADVSNL